MNIFLALKGGLRHEQQQSLFNTGYIFFVMKVRQPNSHWGTTLDVLTTRPTLEHEILQSSKAFNPWLKAGAAPDLSVYYPESCYNMNVAFC